MNKIKTFIKNNRRKKKKKEINIKFKYKISKENNYIV